MRLNELKVIALEEAMLINKEQLESLVGGNGDDSGCFYNCMSYLAGQYGDTEKNSDYFRNDYATGNGSQDDDWEGIDPCEQFAAQLHGPRVYNEDGTLNNDTVEYMSNYFDVDGSGWMNASGTQDALGNLDEDSHIVGMYKTDEATAHAVILTGYSNDQYSYYDPSSGSEGTFSAEDFIGAATVNGMRGGDAEGGTE